MKIEDMARIIDAEASVLGFQGKLAVAQCIADNRFNATAFTTPNSHYYSSDSKKAAEMIVQEGARRYYNAKILQFRSFSKYGKEGEPDWDKVYAPPSNLPYDLVYLGKDSTGSYGHFYFGRYIKMAKPFKMLLIAGHGTNIDGSRDPGAIGCGYQEADLTRELVRLIKQQADLNNLPCDVAPDRNYFSYFKYGNKFDFTPYQYVLEVHFNASAKMAPDKDGNMVGSLMFVDRNEKGVSVEQAILNNLYSIGGKQAWDGIVWTDRNYPTGLMVQNRVRAQGVSHAVLETCFITDGDDMAWYQAKKQLIATKIVEGIIEGFGLGREAENPYQYCGKGIATGEALEDMNVRMDPTIDGQKCGIVNKGLKVEILQFLDNGWMKIVWPGVKRGYAYTSDVSGKYYRIL